jgi:hypothetical protein
MAMRLCFAGIASGRGLWGLGWGSVAARLLVVSDLLIDSTKAIVGLRPSFSAHVSGFPARDATNIRVCGFH